MLNHNHNRLPTTPKEVVIQESERKTQNHLTREQQLSRIQNEIGSKVLALVGFESKNKEIVESSFNKARQNKEKLPGKNNERRNFAYLSRLDRMIEENGSAIEKKLWKASVDNLIINFQDIPEAYWKQQEQILRDNGRGKKLEQEEKERFANGLMRRQHESIATWSNYFTDRNCPYPLWFKVYAFDGVSKMGLINKETKEFERRDKTTVASFPRLNAEVLAKVYRNINEFYGVSKEDWLAQHSDDTKLVSLVKSGNFAKIYAKELFDTKIILKTPERTEDIQGDWFEYSVGNEEQVASLAEGTGWCIADPNVAYKYLSPGSPYRREDGKYEDYKDNKAKFLIYRLKDTESNRGYASNGSASIRLDREGNVAEISGLGESQSIEDSLAPIVIQKAQSLPGGKSYLQNFEDNQELMKLDRKMQHEEDLTTKELDFIYETNRPIFKFDNQDDDPRIPELRNKYDIQYALDKGFNFKGFYAGLSEYEREKNIDRFVEYGVKIDDMIPFLSQYHIAENLKYFISKHGADINLVLSRLSSGNIMSNLDIFIENGLKIDDIVHKLDFDPYSLLHYVEKLTNEYGADINSIVPRIKPKDQIRFYKKLTSYGADIDVNELASKLKPTEVLDWIDDLTSYGADINVNELASKLKPTEVLSEMDKLIRHGAEINIDDIFSKLNSEQIGLYVKELVLGGANINNVISRMELKSILENLSFLIEHGAKINIDELVSQMQPSDIERYSLNLLRNGANINNIMPHLSPIIIILNLDRLIESGVTINRIIYELDSDTIARNLKLLLGHGANVDQIKHKMGKNFIRKNAMLLPESWQKNLSGIR